MKAYRGFILMTAVMIVCQYSFCQKKQDSLVIGNGAATSSGKIATAAPAGKDSTKRIFVPRTAAIRSAILPGLGQAYNKKYWKIPLVYGALGTTAVVFRFNIAEYNKVRFAYSLITNTDTTGYAANYKKVASYLQPFVDAKAANSLRSARNEYRKNVDYSVLVFLLFWALNVVDATVDAHLKGFDVSSDLSLKIKPGINSGLSTPGLSFIFDIHKKKAVRLALP